MVDDSIVRGTTTRGLVALVRAAGAREVHMRVSSPPVTGPCYYGIDTPSREELIAANNTRAGNRRRNSASTSLGISLARRHVGVRALWTATAFATPVSPAIIQRRRRRIRTSCDSAAAARRSPRPRRDFQRSSWPRSARSSITPLAADAIAPEPPPSKSVYFFGDGSAEGTRDMKAVLGGKGANLAEMTNLGVPVPPGFTIACALCIDVSPRRAACPTRFAPKCDDALDASRARRPESGSATRRIRCSSRCDPARRCRCRG